MPARPGSGARPSRAGRPGNRRPGAPGGRGRPTLAQRAAELRRPRLTSRAAILVLVVAVLVVSYASSMRAYLSQHQQLAALRAQIATSQSQLAGLRQEKQRYRDKAYIEEQARQRFGWVLPGQVSYQVIGRNGKPLVGTDRLRHLGGLPAPVPQAWWSKVYGTMTVVDHPPKKAPTPFHRITGFGKATKGTSGSSGSSGHG